MNDRDTTKYFIYNSVIGKIETFKYMGEEYYVLYKEENIPPVIRERFTEANREHIYYGIPEACVREVALKRALKKGWAI